MKPIEPSLMIGPAMGAEEIMTTAIAGPRSLQGVQAPAAATDADNRRLQKAASEFESYFISSLLQEMRKSIPQSGLLGGAPGQEIYQSLFDQSLGQALAQKGGLGLAKQIIQHFLKKEQIGAQEIHGINR